MQLNHGLYPSSPIGEADAVAWVATSTDAELTLYPFKFLPIEPTEVRLKILHTSICHSDIMTIRQHWGPCQYPLCPGHEVIGQITIVGQQVTNVKIGDIVGVSPIRYSDGTCQYCLRGETNLCDDREFLYGNYFGGYATHLQIDHNWVFVVPKGMRIEAIPPLLCAGVTVFAPLKRYQKVGATCAIIGIGGLGHLAIQYANKLGMKVTAFTTKTENIASLKQLGAEKAEHSTDLTKLVHNEGKYDIVLSTLYIDNPNVYRAHQRLTAPGGVYLVIGVPRYDAKYELDSEYFLQKQITVAGSIVGSINGVKEMLEFSALHDINSVNEYFQFQDFNKALHHAEKETPKYRCVINVTNWAKANGFDK